MQLRSIHTDDTLRRIPRSGVPEFQFEYYDDDFTLYDEARIDWHWHDEMEFLVVLSGLVRFRSNTFEAPLEPGSGLFVNRGVIHRFDSSGNARMHTVLFSPEFLAPGKSTVHEKFVAPVSSSGLQWQELDSANPNERAIVEGIRSTYDAANGSSPGRELDVYIEALSLWRRFFYSVDRAAARSSCDGERRQQARARAMADFVNRSFAQRVTLEDIAGAANVSKSEALRCFRTYLHTTPISYLTRRRLEFASEQLKSTSKPVEAIAAESGFSSLAYFSRMFKKKYGQPPSRYRRES